MGLSIADLLLVKGLKKLLEENNGIQREQLKTLKEIQNGLKKA